ncbi:MAG: carbohydrate ABC transporter permease [Phycisphaerales bacterium]
MMNAKASNILGRSLLYSALVAVALFFAGPMIWMLITAMKTEAQAADPATGVLPPEIARVPSIVASNAREVWTDPSVTIPVYLRNTLIIAVLSVVGMTLSSAVVAYGFARIEFKGRGAMFTILLATMMIPFPVVMGPLFVLFKSLGWIGTLKPLWVPAFFAGAFNVFLLRQFMLGIPKELDEAARLDGCGHWGVFRHVILPMTRPALATVALFHFIFVWNDFLGPLIFLPHRDQFTLALGLQLYQSKAGYAPWNLLMMASVITVLPVILVFVAARRVFMAESSGDGVKE